MENQHLHSEAYASIKNEFISIFSSFRQLVAGQLVAIAFIGQQIIPNSKDTLSVLLLSFIFSVIVLSATVIGTTWFIQAVYQASYTFVAYELSELKLIMKVNKDRKERRHLWLLANRSKSLVNTGSAWLDSYYAGSELRIFHFIQIFLSVTAFIIGNYFVLSKLKEVDIFLFSIVELFMIFNIGCSIFYLSVSKNIVTKITNQWILFFKNRENIEKKYLDDNNWLEFVEKHN